jgi:hypothetical protein
MAGEAVLLETIGLDQRQQEKVIERFNHDRNEGYQEFIGRCTDFEAEIAKETGAKHFSYGELEENDEDLKKQRVARQNMQTRLLRCAIGARGDGSPRTLRNPPRHLRPQSFRRSGGKPHRSK